MLKKYLELDEKYKRENYRDSQNAFKHNIHMNVEEKIFS